MRERQGVRTAGTERELDRLLTPLVLREIGAHPERGRKAWGTERQRR
jgi:hypothetical protein